MAKFYILDGPKSPWGDYSDVLIAGMSGHLGRQDGRMQLERTGPYVPPISFPGLSDIVVTDSFRHELESSVLTGLRFQPVTKKRIVHLDWHTWDCSTKEPPEYPEEGEPEGYILDRPHSQDVSDQIGDLWELLVEERATVQRETKTSRILLVGASWCGEDLFRAKGVGYIYTTETGKAWFKQHAPEHVSFKEVGVV